MTERWGMPGPGGSLGKCAICGEPFVAEVILDKIVKAFGIPGQDVEFYAHESCYSLMSEIKRRRGTWYDLPEGPLRNAMIEAIKKQEAADADK